MTRRWVVAAFLGVATAVVACTALWPQRGHREGEWARTRLELELFRETCESRPHEDQGVLVFDARHGDWVGIGDSASRILALLRIGQELNAKTYIWSNPCADRGGPPRVLLGSRSNGTACTFDAGEWFESLSSGVWQWTAAHRRATQRLYEREHVLGFLCTLAGAGGRCLRARPPFHAPQSELLVLRSALEAHRWVRLELTTLDDLRSVGEALEHNRRCDLFAHLRPRPALWAALAPHLDRVAGWQVFGALAVRTGLADHADLFAPHQNAFDGGAVMRLFQACPAGTPTVTRAASAKNPPCVAYQSHAGSSAFLPSNGRYHELAAYVHNVSGTAAALGSPWGMVVLTDAPAVHCLARQLVGNERLLANPPVLGHTQYSSDRRVAAAAAVDFYLVGLADFVVELTPSKFSGVGRERSVLPSPAVSVLPHGWPQFFLAGNERELMTRQTAESRHETVVMTLSQKCY
jgi:hypothetical protein